VDRTCSPPRCKWCSLRSDLVSAYQWRPTLLALGGASKESAPVALRCADDFRKALSRLDAIQPGTVSWACHTRRSSSVQIVTSSTQREILSGADYSNHGAGWKKQGDADGPAIRLRPSPSFIKQLNRGVERGSEQCQVEVRIAASGGFFQIKLPAARGYFARQNNRMPTAGDRRVTRPLACNRHQ